MEVPTVKVYGKDGSLAIINESDLQEWLDNGYSTEPTGENKQTEEESSVDFSKYSDEELMAFAAIVKIPGTVKKRDTLIAKLIEAGFQPE
jgi:hypothetical protein